MINQIGNYSLYISLIASFYLIFQSSILIRNNFKYLKLKSANIEKNKSIYVFWYDIEEKKSEDFLSNIKNLHIYFID